MLYREYIENKKKKYIGKSMNIDGKIYHIVDVDYNGALIIDKRAEFTETTAVPESWFRIYGIND